MISISTSFETNDANHKRHKSNLKGLKRDVNVFPMMINWARFVFHSHRETRMYCSTNRTSSTIQSTKYISWNGRNPDRKWFCMQNKSKIRNWIFLFKKEFLKKLILKIRVVYMHLIKYIRNIQIHYKKCSFNRNKKISTCHVYTSIYSISILYYYFFSLFFISLFFNISSFLLNKMILEIEKKRISSCKFYFNKIK